MANTDISVYVRTWFVLLALLAFNVACSFLVPGLFAPWLHPGIAGIQALLMMAVFMSLRSAGVLLRLVAMAGFFWLFLLFALTLGDYETRFEDVAIGRLTNSPPAANTEPQRATAVPDKSAEPPSREDIFGK